MYFSPHTLHVYSFTPSSSHVGSFVTVPSPFGVWANFAIFSSLITFLQVEHLNTLVPSFEHVGCSVTSPSSFSVCPKASISIFWVSWQLSQESQAISLYPFSSHVGSFVYTTISPKWCSNLATSSVFVVSQFSQV